MRVLFFAKYYFVIFWVCLLTIVLLPSLSSANWRNDVGIFRMGVVAEGETSSFFQKLEPFRLALSGAMKIEVEFYSSSSATAIIDAFKSERIEYAILPSAAYALAWVACECVDPIAVSKAADSTDGYHTVVIARPNGPASINQLAGKKIGVLFKGSLTGQALPLHLLAGEGAFLVENLVTYEKPAQAIEALISGDTDALIGWSSITGNPSDGYSRGTLTKIAELNGGDASDYEILWQSPQIPHRTHVVRRKLSGEVKRILRETLLNLFDSDPTAYDAVEPIFGGGFGATRQDRYNVLIDFTDQLHQKLEAKFDKSNHLEKDDSAKN